MVLSGKMMSQTNSPDSIISSSNNGSLEIPSNERSIEDSNDLNGQEQESLEEQGSVSEENSGFLDNGEYIEYPDNSKTDEDRDLSKNRTKKKWWQIWK
jgi:hypothetical protein